MRLFEQWCLPSVIAQHDTNARWLVMFDAESPEWLHRRIEQWRSICPLLEPCFFTANEVMGFANTSTGRQVHFINRAISSRIDSDTQWLLTTNLDNDDALADDTLHRIEKAFMASPSMRVISMVNGLQIFPRFGAAMKMHYPHNHFLTLCEPWTPGKEAVTIESLSHREARRQYEVEDIADSPAWIEVVHDANVSNDLRITSRIGYRPMLHAVSLKQFGQKRTISAASQIAGTARIALYFFKVAAWRLHRKLKK